MTGDMGYEIVFIHYFFCLSNSLIFCANIDSFFDMFANPILKEVLKKLKNEKSIKS